MLGELLPDGLELVVELVLVVLVEALQFLLLEGLDLLLRDGLDAALLGCQLGEVGVLVEAEDPLGLEVLAL